MKNVNEMKYFLYCRKSTDTEDKQIMSIDDQITEMKMAAERQGIKIVDIITESMSAKAPGRPEFSKMLERIYKGEANGILCWKLNRLARNMVDGGNLINMLQTNVISHIQTYGRGYYPTDNVILLAVEFGMANQYVNDLSVDTRRGMRNKARRGWYPCATLPMGYRHNPEKEDRMSEIIIDKEKWEMVNELWKLALEGWSVPDIKRKADSLGVKNKKGKNYSVNTYYNMFSNIFYAGHFYWNDENREKKLMAGKHEPLLSLDDFNRVQKLLGKRGKPTRANKYKFTFRGPIHCGECGCSITAERKEQCICTNCKHKFSNRNNTTCTKCGTDIADMTSPTMIDKTYYRCTKRRSDMKCSQKYLLEHELEEQINTVLGSITIPQDFYEWAVEGIKYIHANEVNEQRQISKQLNAKETDLVDQLNGFFKMRANNEISKDQLDFLTSQTNQELLQIRDEIKTYHERVVDWVKVANQYLEFSAKAYERFNKGDNEVKKQILESLGSNLTIKDKKLNVSLPKPINIFVSTYKQGGTDKEWFERKKALDKQGLSHFLEGDSPTLLRPLFLARTSIMARESVVLN